MRAANRMNKKVLLVIASNGFQPHEFAETKKVLENNYFSMDVASDKTGVTKDGLGVAGPEVKILVEDVKVSDYVGIFLIGGSGALDCLDNKNVHELMRLAKDADILWGAICISPRILCKAGLLDGKKITGWDDDGKLKSSCPKALVQAQAVVVDGNLITANGPKAAQKFGETIVAELQKKK